MKKWWFSLLCFACLSFTLQAEEPWSLERCVKYAYENNLQLKQQVLSSMLSKNNLLQSKLNLLPTLNGSAGYNVNKGRALDQTTYQFIEGETVKGSNFSINSSATLFAGFQKINTIEENRYTYLAALQNVEKLKNDLALNIASVYLEILNYREQVKVAEDQLALTRLQIDRTRKLVEAGSSPEGDLLNIEAQGAQEESNLIAYQNGLDIAMLTLVQLLDLGAGEGFSVVVPDFSAYVPVDLAFSSEDIFKTARETFPQIKSASYNIKSADKALSVAKAGFSPRLSLASSWSSSYSSTRQKVIAIDESGMPIYGPYSFSDQFNNNQNWSFGLNLSVPIFNGWQTRTSVDNAKIQRENARLQYSVAENQLFKDIQQSYIDALAAWKKFLSSEKSVQAQQEAFRYTEQKYEVGLVQFVEYSTAKNKLSLAQSELIQSKYNYIFRTKVLDFYRNIPISL